MMQDSENFIDADTLKPAPDIILARWTPPRVRPKNRATRVCRSSSRQIVSNLWAVRPLNDGAAGWLQEPEIAGAGGMHNGALLLPAGRPLCQFVLAACRAGLHISTDVES